MMHNPFFIRLLALLEERGWQYEIQQDVFRININHMEFEFSKHEKAKTLDLIDMITRM